MAEAASGMSISWAFIASIFFLNVANTFATSLDYMATSSNAKLHTLLYCAIFFAVGMLCFSISTTVYGGIDASVSVPELVTLFFGTCFGCGLIVALMKLEHHINPEDDGGEAPQLEKLAKKLRKQLIFQQDILVCRLCINTVDIVVY
jgi:hypothetical protein